MRAPHTGCADRSLTMLFAHAFSRLAVWDSTICCQHNIQLNTIIVQNTTGTGAADMQAKHKGHKSHESKKKWRNKVEKITELLTVMDKMKAPGGMPFVHTRDISACEDLLEAYFMQVGSAYNVKW